MVWTVVVVVVVWASVYEETNKNKVRSHANL